MVCLSVVVELITFVVATFIVVELGVFGILLILVVVYGFVENGLVVFSAAYTIFVVVVPRNFVVVSFDVDDSVFSTSSKIVSIKPIYR